METKRPKFSILNYASVISLIGKANLIFEIYIRMCDK
nr:MAG TPA: hypothetical protein [Caudoviricetes sp.]